MSDITGLKLRISQNSTRFTPKKLARCLAINMDKCHMSNYYNHTSKCYIHRSKLTILEIPINQWGGWIATSASKTYFSAFNPPEPSRGPSGHSRDVSGVSLPQQAAPAGRADIEASGMDVVSLLRFTSEARLCCICGGYSFCLRLLLGLGLFSSS